MFETKGTINYSCMFKKYIHNTDNRYYMGQPHFTRALLITCRLWSSTSNFPGSLWKAKEVSWKSWRHWNRWNRRELWVQRVEPGAKLGQLLLMLILGMSVVEQHWTRTDSETGGATGHNDDDISKDFPDPRISHWYPRIRNTMVNDNDLTATEPWNHGYC